MKEQVAKYIDEHNLINEKDRVVVGVSGGSDSVVLAHVLHALGFKVAVAHANFGLRGQESDGDEQFVKEWARAMGWECHTRHFDCSTHGEGSVQMRARELRYGWFAALCESHGYTKVAAAHHREDQVETFFLNLFRGSGTKGLRGMLPCRDQVIRPLLECTKEQVLTYIKQHDLRFREDSSNSADKYARNRIRQQLLPLLEELEPGALDRITESVGLLQEAEQITGAYVLGLNAAQHSPDRTVINKEIVGQSAAPATVLYYLLQDFGYNKHQVTNILNLFEGEPGATFNSNSHQLVVDRAELIVTLKEDVGEETVLINKDDDRIVNPIRLIIGAVDAQNWNVPESTGIAALDRSKLVFPLELRRWQEGDWFIPLGMNGRKKLSDYFVDEKWSVPDKRSAWILVSGDDVVWIVGHRIDDRYKVTGQTKEVYQLELTKPNE